MGPIGEPPARSPSWVVIDSSELGDGPLNAVYWVTRREGESYPDWRRRTSAEDMLRRAAAHEAQAARLRERAAQVYPEAAP
jgi:hypothetical protein